MTTASHTQTRSPVAAQRAALTLVELVVVMAILVALAGLVVPQLASQAESARTTAATASLVKMRDALSQFWSDCKYDLNEFVGPDRRVLATDLLENPGVSGFEPSVGLGWRGPYLEPSSEFVYQVNGSGTGGFTTVYGADGDPCVIDPWGSPLIVMDPDFLVVNIGEQRTVRIVSAGPNRRVDVDETWTDTELAAAVENEVIDDIYVSLTLR